MSALLITIGWNVTAILALAGHLWSANDARIDLRSIAEDGNLHSLMYTARFNMRLSLALALVQGIDLAIGILAFADRPPTTPAPLTIIAILISIGLIVQELMLLSISFAVVWFRRRLREIVRSEIQQDLSAGGL